MEGPVVSVIMPCFNAEKYLEQSIGSVLDQTFIDWELVAVDDGSTDATGNWLKGVSDSRVKVVRQENKGLPAARNAGIRNAKGRYMVFLDADDTLHPQYLECMVSALESDAVGGIAYCGWQNLGLPGARGKPFIPPDYENKDKIKILLERCRWPVHAALLRRDVVKEAKGFDETQKSAEDFEFWLRTAIKVRLVRVPRVLAYYHHHGDGQMSQNLARMAHCQYRAQRKYLAANPNAVKELGWRTVRRLLYGKLLELGYKSYWARDIRGARSVFRIVMAHGYGRLRDYKYMLPSVLPYGVQVWLIKRMEQQVDG